jgi:phosphinothricin acetyltransferase
MAANIAETIVRPATAADGAAIADIYNPFITDTVVTFEEEPVDARGMARRIDDVQAASLPWIVAEEGGRVVGYAYASRFRTRAAYRFSTEVTVYLAAGCEGRGLGTRLYNELFEQLRALGVHVVIGGIALPNDASVALHEKLGLRKVAHFAEVGFKFNRWVDVGFWQRTL